MVAAAICKTIQVYIARDFCFVGEKSKFSIYRAQQVKIDIEKTIGCNGNGLVNDLQWEFTDEIILWFIFFFSCDSMQIAAHVSSL